MSLFDVIKYGNTDITESNELNKLPDNLIDLYYDMSKLNNDFSYMVTWWDTASAIKRRKCQYLAYWAHCDSRSGLFNECIRIFKSALERYEPI